MKLWIRMKSDQVCIFVVEDLAAICMLFGVGSCAKYRAARQKSSSEESILRW